MLLISGTAILLALYNINFSHGLCDQRQYGGELKCCNKQDSNCYVKVQKTRSRGQTNSICYCDNHCSFTNDCCDDIEEALELCKGKCEFIISLLGKQRSQLKIYKGTRNLLLLLFAD